jgi:hypothetical protein
MGRKLLAYEWEIATSYHRVTEKSLQIPSPGLKATLPMNPGHPRTPSLSPSEGEREGVRGFMGGMRVRAVSPHPIGGETG